MAEIKVGVRQICLRVPGPEGLETAAQIGADSVQLTVGRGEEYGPDVLDADGIREVRQRVQDLGMVISATDGGLGDLGDADTAAERVDKTKRLIDHTRELGAPVLTSHIGIVPKDANAPRRQVFNQAMEEIGKHAEQTGMYFGIETGPEPAQVLLELIESIDTDGIKINLDPANFIIWWARIAKDEGRPYDREQAFAESDPHEAVYILRDHIIHTHIKDARIDDDGERDETPVGQGWIEWSRYLKSYQDIGFTGYHCIEREAGENRVEETREAIAFVRRTWQELD
jgi:sugar phosphate isomerase/epimerase